MKNDFKAFLNFFQKGFFILWKLNSSYILEIRTFKNKIMKNLITLVVVCFASHIYSQVSLGEVVGEVVDKKSNLAIVDAHVFIDDNGKRYQTKTDLDGRFRISAIPAGTYSLYIRQYEDTMKNVFVEVPMDGFYNTGKIAFTSTVLMLEGGGVTARNTVRLIDGNLPVVTMTAKEIDKSPAKFDIKSLVSSMSSDVRMTEDGELVFRGARKGDMIYLIDGVKTRDAGSVTGVSIGRMMVYTGGLPAKYGDTLGGVVVMESKSYFDLYRSWEAEQLKGGN